MIADTAAMDQPREIGGLPVAEFGFPGPLRDELVAAILRGDKTATASLRVEYQPAAKSPVREADRWRGSGGTGRFPQLPKSAPELPRVGERAVVVDSEHRPVAVIETTELRVVRAGDVDEQFARDEGEGFESVADWRAAHERFWGATPEREAAGEPPHEIDDDTLVVCERFRVTERL
jgi:uncharacterized protein YhfF